MPRAGQRRGPQLRAPYGSTPPSPRELKRGKWQLQGLEAAGRLLGSSLTQMLAKILVEVGPLMSSREAGHIRPTLGGRSPTKNFVKGIEEAPEIPARDSGSLQEMPVPEEY